MHRRSFLAVVATAGLVGVSGCTSTDPRPQPTGSGTATALPQGDDELRSTVAQAEQQLISLYAQALRSADPDLAESLRALQAQHVEHAQRLMPGQPVSTEPPAASNGSEPTPSRGAAGASERPTGSPGPASPTSASPSPSPGPRTVLAGLRRAELAALDQRTTACDQAEDPGLVRTLCLIAASEAQHADVLAGLRAEIPR